MWHHAPDHSPPAPRDPRVLPPAALNAAGWLALVQHASYGSAIALLDEAGAAARDADDEAALVRGRAFLGLTLALATKEFARSEEVLDQAVVGARSVGDSWALALALYGQDHLALVQGDAERDKSDGRPAPLSRRRSEICMG